MSANSNTERLEYRRSFPRALRAHIGQRELIASLGAKSLSDLGAAQRYKAANEEFDRIVGRARRAVSGAFDELDRPRMAWIVESYEAAFLAADDAARVAGKADPERHEAADSGWTDILEQGNAAHIREMFADEAVSLASEQGWVIERSGGAFSTLCLEMLRAMVRANRLRMERDEGHPVPRKLADKKGSTCLSGNRIKTVAVWRARPFRRPFVCAGLLYFNPHSFRDMMVRHAMTLNLSPELMKALSQIWVTPTY